MLHHRRQLCLTEVIAEWTTIHSQPRIMPVSGSGRQDVIGIEVEMFNPSSTPDHFSVTIYIRQRLLILRDITRLEMCPWQESWGNGELAVLDDKSSLASSGDGFMSLSRAISTAPSRLRIGPHARRRFGRCHPSRSTYPARRSRRTRLVLRRTRRPYQSGVPL